MSEPFWSALGARAGAGGVDYEGVWSNIVPYLAGDVVLHNGVNYLAVNPSTGVEPSTGGVAGIGTSLPVTPTDGQEFTLVDSLTAPTFSWKFRYIAAKASNKWVFVGGAPGFSEVAAFQNVGTANTYLALATAGPLFAIPVAGNYVVEIGCEFQVNPGANSIMRMSYDIGGTGAVDADSVNVFPGAFGATAVGSRATVKALTALTLTSKYKANDTGATFGKRWMRVIPVAVGG